MARSIKRIRLPGFSTERLKLPDGWKLNSSVSDLFPIYASFEAHAFELACKIYNGALEYRVSVNRNGRHTPRVAAKGCVRTRHGLDDRSMRAVFTGAARMKHGFK